ncbi:MAG: c-type cytochrome biogenesis protein CcmI [Alphaproteobacteria bacterium]|nr:c-type cytochrome biogenesis protein CcmI [Alphaproteobacteria bacterium]
MLIWIFFAVLTAVIVFVVLGPLAERSRAAENTDDAANLAVYRAQITEVDADLERGVIGEEEAKAARVELSRKLLQATEHDDAGNPVQADTPKRPTANHLAIILAGLIPLLAIGIYVPLGSPNVPDQPHAPRLNENLKDASAVNLLARVEARLRTHPEDGKGWDVVAPFYVRTGRFADAANAYRNAARLLGETPERLIGYVKSAILANNGIVTEDLRRTAERLSQMAPERPEPKFWLALALEQDGNLTEATKAYEDLLSSATEDAPWREMVQGRLNGLQNPKPE